MLLVVLVGEKVFDGKLMNGQQPVQAVDGNVHFSLLNTPVMDTWQVVVVRKTFSTGVPFFLSQLLQLPSNFLQCFLD